MKQDLYKIQNLRAFEVKYLGPTNNNGSRIKITDTRNKISIIISYDYEANNATETALKYLNSIGFRIVTKVCLERTDLLLTDDFTTAFGKVN